MSAGAELVTEGTIGWRIPMSIRLGYAHGKRDLAYVKSLVDSGEFSVGFGLLPVTVMEMKQIANEGLTMPPKSTYIEPKLRSGVTIYEF